MEIDGLQMAYSKSMNAMPAGSFASNRQKAPRVKRTRSSTYKTTYFAFSARKPMLWVLLLAGLMGSAAAEEPAATEPPPDAMILTQKQKPTDFNDEIYYRNKLEFSQEVGVLPINIPFVFDVFVGDDYTQKPLHYTLAPVFPSLRWQMGKLNGPWFLRGNTDLALTLSVTAIPRGPETHYEAFDIGFRRNFVPRNWRATPYFEARVGVGDINAKGPEGVIYAQGQDLTYTLMVGSGARYNFNPRYSMALGISYMHVSNMYESEPKYTDNGINVYGPMVGFNMRLGRPRQTTVQ